MRSVKRAIFMGLASGILVFAMTGEPASAACRNFQASHNGTDMFHPTGAAGAAANKLMAQVDGWQRQKGYRKLRMSKVRTKCGEWFTKYLLPHRHCVAEARACAS